MRLFPTIISATLAVAVGVRAQAEFTLEWSPTATAAIAYQASQYLGNPAYAAAEDAVYQAALNYRQTASVTRIGDAAIASQVTPRQWEIFTSVRGVENALNTGGSAAAGGAGITSSTRSSQTGSASSSTGVTASATASATVSGMTTMATPSAILSQSAGAATSSSQSAGAARATGAWLAAAGMVAGLAYAL